MGGARFLYAGRGVVALGLAVLGVLAAPSLAGAGATPTVGTGTASVLVLVPGSAKVGDPVTYQAVVVGATTPTGTVDFTDDADPTLSCAGEVLTAPANSSGVAVATCAATALFPGSHTITASYSGDSTFANASNANSYPVFAVGSSTSLTAAPTNPVTNQPVTLTATVKPVAGAASGTVGFMDQNSPIADCAARPIDTNGTASCTTTFAAAGAPASLTATYGPDNHALAAGSIGTASLNIGAAASTTAVSAALSAPTVGQSVTYTATVTPAQTGPTAPGGTVAFYDGSSAIPSCTAQPLSGTTATCTVAYATTGSHPITAAYGGDANFTGSTSFPPQTVTVGPKPAPAVDATTRRTSHLSTTAAVLNGRVATQGMAVQWQFQYGSTFPFTHATPLRSIGAGRGTVSVAQQLHKLKPGTVYQYELVVIPAGGAPSFGDAVTFTTKPLGKVALPAHTFTASSKTIAIPARCQSKTTCTGHVSLFTKPATRAATAASCGSVAYRIAAGSTGSATLKLRHACAVLLTSKHRHLRATLTLSPTSGQLPLTRSVTIIRG